MPTINQLTTLNTLLQEQIIAKYGELLSRIKTVPSTSLRGILVLISKVPHKSIIIAN